MAADSNKYLIKIFSGPHQGAEIELSGNQCVIGSGEGCDVILADSLISKKHAKINVRSGKLSLEALDEGVYYDGKWVQGKLESIEPYKFVSIGTTHFLIGPKDEKWPNITAADIPELKKAVEEGKETVIGGEKVVAEGEKAVGIPVEEQKSSFKMPLVILSIAVAIMVLVALIFGSTRSLVEVESEFNAQVAKDSIVKVIDGFKMSDNLSVEEDSYNERIVVSGFVETAQERHRLTSALLDASEYAVVRIDSQEFLLNSLRETISRYKLDVEVESADLGSATLIGYVQKTDEWDKVKKIINQDVMGIKELKDEVVTGDDIILTLTKMAADAGIKGDLIFIPLEKTIQVLGNLVGDELELWTELKAKATRLYAGKLTISDNVRAADIFIEQKRYFDTPIESVNIKNIGWIGLRDGRRYFVGSTLPSGYVIEEISSKGIRLVKEDEEITLDLGDL